MSRLQATLLVERVQSHAKAGFTLLLDYDHGDTNAIVDAFLEAVAIVNPLGKLGLNSDFPEGSSLSIEKLQNMTKGLDNSHQKTNFVNGFTKEMDQYAVELWAYFEGVSLTLEKAQQR